MNIPNYLDLARRGIHVIVQYVIRARSDYVGERFQVGPFFKLFDVRTFYQELLSKLARNVKHADLKEFYMVYVIGTLIQRHNFTFDTVRPSHNDIAFGAWCDGRKLEMRSKIVCLNEVCSIGISLSEFTDYQTLMTSELLSPAYYKLSSLAMPPNPTVVCMALGAAVIVGLLISLRVRPSIAAKRVWFHDSCWNLLPFVTIPSKRRMWLCMSWVVVVCFLSIVYLSMLQSAVVAPASYQSEISFARMVRQNFSFLTTNAKALQTVVSLADREKTQGNNNFTNDEVVLGERIKETRWSASSAPSFLLSLSQKEQRVLVEDHMDIRL